MRCVAIPLLLSLAVTPAVAEQVAQVQASYDTYAAGIQILQAQAFFGFGPWNYRIDVDYRTTGLVGLLYSGHTSSAVHGVWDDDRAAPSEFFGEGTWNGQQRRTLIDYNHGVPVVKDLEPPQTTDRGPVPPALQLHTIDLLSALAQLVRKVQLTNTCDTTVHTYDGRRVLQLTARTGGTEQLEPNRRSVYSGPALRCDFEGNELAGFLLSESDPARRKPLLGSAWLAPMVPDAPPLPVRIEFRTNWFGWASMYLTQAHERPLEGVANK